jgi:hypothetical protein
MGLQLAFFPQQNCTYRLNFLNRISIGTPTQNNAGMLFIFMIRKEKSIDEIPGE